MYPMMISTIIFLTTMFVFLNHPLSLGVVLLIQTIMMAMITGMMASNYWFSYMIFLIMIGGMLILFIYMTSIASNEKFKFSSKLLLLLIPTFIIILLFIFIDGFFLEINLKNDFIYQNNNYELTISLTKFINSSLKTIFFMIIIYLLITLIMVVKITDIKSGPLRQMN